MADLTMNKKRYVREEGKETPRSFPIASGLTFYQGSLVAINSSGYAVKASQTGSLRFVGVAKEYAVNPNATSVDTSKVVVVEHGHIEQFAYASATNSAIGQKIYAIDDQVVSTAGSTTHKIGDCIGYGTDTILVRVLPDYA